METTEKAMCELLDGETIAVVGASRSPGKAAHDVPRYLVDAGYDVRPVNPNADEVLGRMAHDSLADLEEPVDVVNVFRPSEEVAGVIEQVLDRNDGAGIWLQQGIRDDEAASVARAAGHTVVQDRCIKVEHRRLGQS